MDKEIIDILNVMNTRMADMNKRLDNVFMELHNINANNIKDNSTGIMETYDLAAENSDEISECRTALEEIYEMIIPEEES